MNTATGTGSPVAATGTFTVSQAATQIGGTFTLAGSPAAAQFLGTLPTSIAANSPGSYPLTVTYSGDNNYAAGSPGTPPRLTVTQVAPSSETLTSSLNGAGLNQAVTFTLTVNATAGTPAERRTSSIASPAP